MEHVKCEMKRTGAKSTLEGQQRKRSPQGVVRGKRDNQVSQVLEVKGEESLKDQTSESITEGRNTTKH